MLPVEPQNTLITWPTDGRLRDVHSCLVTGRFFTSPPIFFSHPQKRFWNENEWLWGVYLVTFIQILPPFAFFGIFLYFGFWGFFRSFLSFWNFWKCFWNENGWLWGVLFSEIYSFESSLYDFWILVIFGGPFLG